MDKAILLGAALLCCGSASAQVQTTCTAMGNVVNCTSNDLGNNPSMQQFRDNVNRGQQGVAQAGQQLGQMVNRALAPPRATYVTYTETCGLITHITVAYENGAVKDHDVSTSAAEQTRLKGLLSHESAPMERHVAECKAGVWMGIESA